jgi:hypothetical protein
MTTTPRQEDAKNNNLTQQQPNPNRGKHVLFLIVQNGLEEKLGAQDKQRLGRVCKHLDNAVNELEGQYKRKPPDSNGVGDGCTGWLSEEELDERAYNHGTDLVYYLPQEYWN